MKKFCNKFTKQQWRVTVPNINTNIFRRSTSKEKEEPNVINKLVKSSSGSYDLEAAAAEFEKNHNVGNALVLSDSSDSDSDDNYEDARAMSERLSSTDDLDTSVYADVESSQRSETSKCISESNSKYEYDVPKISFSFFEEENQHEYQVVNVKKKHKAELKIDKLANEENEYVNGEANEYKTVNVDEVEPENPKKPENANEPKNINESKDINEPKDTNDDPIHVSQATIVLSSPSNDSDASKVSKSVNDLTDTITETKLVELYLTKSLNDCSAAPQLMKSGSDPAISHSHMELDKDDEFVYKVPGAVRRYRYSQSLDDFNIEEVDVVSSAHSSIEHISCSQVIVEKAKTEPETGNGNVSAQNSASMEYCKARSKMPQKKRKITLLRRPRNMGWTNLRTKLNNVMIEHAAKQRVGAFADKERPVINIEEMYKTSKDKCKKMLKHTGKIFNKPKKDQENVDPNNQDGSSQILKNDAFFANVHKGLKASDIEYKMSENGSDNNTEVIYSGSVKSDRTDKSDKSFGTRALFGFSKSLEDEKSEDFPTLKHGFRRSKSIPEGPTGFDDLRRYVKQGGDFCKELSTILQERSEAELQYAKSLSKLSGKLARASREGVGGSNDAWRSVAVELETRAEAHRLFGTALLEDAARPLRNLTESQHKIRKQVETVVDKAAKGLSDWRTAEAKSKKHSHACARDNEKLQDALLDVRISKTTSLIQLAHMHNQKALSEKENAKLEGKKRKAEDAVKKADIEYYTLCVRAERARLEWESAVLKGTNTFQTVEEERLNNLKSILTSYLHHSSELGPRLVEATERLSGPVTLCETCKDLITFVSLRNSSQQTAEQLLPDFYCEHITLAMNRERRKQALVKLLQLIRQDIERERKSKNGLENLSKAMKQTPNFGAEESQQNVSEKLYHMKSMLTYLEGARYKVQSALAELDSRPRAGHPLAPHITITRDKSGLQQSVLKVPQWLREEWVEPETSPLSEKSVRSEHISDTEIPEPDWADRGAADGNSNQHDSDFDEFSSQGSSSGGLCSTEESPVQPIEQCKALYAYTPNLPDELTLHPGDILSVYRKQEDGWWLGECKGSVGIFPATYVETLQA